MSNMRRNEPRDDPSWEEGVHCVDCGQSVFRAVDRYFALGEELMLCANCSLRRGGEYDAHRDVWKRAPFVDDLSRPGELPD